MLSTLLSLAIVAQCQTYSVACDCGPSTPFEGLQIYVVEKCDKEETWHGQYGQQQYSTYEECSAGIADNKVCQDLSL